MTLTYVIIAAGDGSSGDFSQVYETSPDTLRWNLDPAGTKTFLKFKSSDPTPSFLEGNAQYPHAEILEVLATSEWTAPETP